MSAKKVKWSISGDEPDDLPYFRSNDEIGLPPVGIYTFEIDRVLLCETQKGDERLVFWLRIDEKGDAKKWNGYTVWEGFNLIPQSLPFLKRFLGILGLTWKEFINNSLMDDSADPPEVTKIGSVRFAGGRTKVKVRAKTKHGTWDGEDRLEIARFLSDEAELPGDIDAGDDADDSDADDVDSDLSVADEPASSEKPTESVSEDAEEFEPWTEEELNDMDLDDLKAEAKEFGIELKPRMRKASIVNAILEAQEKDEPEPEPDAKDDTETLDDLSEDMLRDKAKELGASPREIRRANNRDKLVELVEELEGEPPF